MFLLCQKSSDALCCRKPPPAFFRRMKFEYRIPTPFTGILRAGFDWNFGSPADWTEGDAHCWRATPHHADANIACGVGKLMIIHRLPLTTCVIHIRRSRRWGLRWVPKQQMMRKKCHVTTSSMLPTLVIRRFTRRTALQNYKWTCGPQDTTSLCQETAIWCKIWALEVHPPHDVITCDRCGPIILFLSCVHKDMIRFKLKHSVFSTESIPSLPS